MSASEVLPLLKSHAFFEGMDERHLAALAGHCRVVDFPVRKTIFEEFERAKEVYFLIEGQVSLAICDASGCRQITRIGPGELLGWSPLIGRSRLFDTARTATNVKALAFDGDDLLAFCREHPEFGFEVMRRTAVVLGERLAATRIQLLELSGVHFPEVPLESD